MLCYDKKGGVGGGEAPYLRRVKPMWSIFPHAVTDDSGVFSLKYYHERIEIYKLKLKLAMSSLVIHCLDF